MIVKNLNNWRKIMKKITISDLDGFTDICECEKMLGELKAGCVKENYNPFKEAGGNEDVGDAIEDFFEESYPKGPTYAPSTSK